MNMRRNKSLYNNVKKDEILELSKGGYRTFEGVYTQQAFNSRSGVSPTSAIGGLPRVSGRFISAENISKNNAVYLYNGQVDGGITLDTSATGDASTLSIAVGNNNNRVMVIFIQNDTGDNVTAASYNGIAATFIRKVNYMGAIWMYAYYLIAPTIGTANVAVTSSSGNLKIWAWSLYNCLQSSQPDVSGQNTGTGNTASGSVTTVANGTRIVFYACNGTVASSDGNTGNPVNLGGGELGNNTPNPNGHTGLSNIIATPAATTQSIDWTSAISPAWGVIQVSVKPATTYSQVLGKASAATAATANGFIGFAKKDITARTKGEIIIGGTAPGFSGLTIGTQYYLSDTAGAIQTTAGTVSRKVGIAVSSDKIEITNIW